MKGIREIIPWPSNLPNTRVVKFSGMEKLVGANMCDVLREIMK